MEAIQLRMVLGGEELEEMESADLIRDLAKSSSQAANAATQAAKAAHHSGFTALGDAAKALHAAKQSESACSLLLAAMKLEPEVEAEAEASPVPLSPSQLLPIVADEPPPSPVADPPPRPVADGSGKYTWDEAKLRNLQEVADLFGGFNICASKLYAALVGFCHAKGLDVSFSQESLKSRLRIQKRLLLNAPNAREI